MKSFELLDVIQHATPSIVNIDIELTSAKVKNANGSINNYNMAIENISAYCSGHQKLEDLLVFLRTHPNPKWRPHLEDVGTRLLEIFGREKSRWYDTGRRAVESVGGLRVKPAIRGVWAANGKAFPCLINPRSSVILERRFNLPFVARGVYEFHVRDESVAGAMVVDLGKDLSSGVRANRVYFPEQTDMMTVEEFENVLRNFNAALTHAGLKPKSVSSAIDLFRA